MATTAAGIIGLLGIVLLVLGLRGRRLDDHPICRACRFDLYKLPEQHESCPECGRDITRPRTVRTGNRRRRWVAACFGGLLALAASGVIGVTIWADATQFNWNTVKPTWMLMFEVQGNDAQRTHAALSELNVRLNAGTLAVAAVADLVNATLTAHGDEQVQWLPGWERLLESMMQRGLLGDEQVAQLAEQAVIANLTMRPRVRQGGTMLATIEVEFFRTPLQSPLRLEVHGETFQVDGQEMLRGRGGGSTGFGGTFSVGPYIEFDVSPGKYPVLAAWELTVVDASTGRERAKWHETFETELEVVEADGDEIGLITDEAIGRKLKQLIRPRHTWLGPNPDRQLPQGMIDFRAIPIDVAFEVFWRIGEREWPMGEVRWERSNDSTGRHSVGYHTMDPDDIVLGDATHVTIILRPNVEAARRSATMTRIWGKELIFKDVPLYRAGEYPPPDPGEGEWWHAEIEP